jgi:uncharacterized protein involved in cysteine biosynthesis
VYGAALIYLIFLCARVLASPFNAVLSEKILIKNQVLDPRSIRLGTWVLISVRMFLITLAESFVFLILGCFLFFFSFIPGLNIVSAFCALLILAFDCMDYTFENLQFPLRVRMQLFREHFSFFSGLACCLGLTLFIPGLNFLVFPCAVAGCADYSTRKKEAFLHAKSGSESNSR